MGRKTSEYRKRLALEAINVELENIQAAWKWTMLQQDVFTINESLEHLT